MNQHHFPELAALCAVICNLALTFFVLSRDLRSALNRVVFHLWGMSVTIWNLGTFPSCFAFRLDGSPANHGQALFWAKFLQFGVIFLPVSLFHLGLMIARVPSGRMLPLLYGLQVILALTNFSRAISCRACNTSGLPGIPSAGPVSGFHVHLSCV